MDKENVDGYESEVVLDLQQVEPLPDQLHNNPQ